ncbi:MAG: hypothetical protein R2777_03050 [Chitinophagales bacterium]
MKLSFEKGKVTRLQNMDKFVDGAAVAKVGNLTYKICKTVLDDIVLVPEEKPAPLYYKCIMMMPLF